MGIRKKTGLASKGWAKKVRVIGYDTVYDSVRDLAKDLNVDYSDVYKVLRGTRPHVGGFQFEYVEDD